MSLSKYGIMRESDGFIFFKDGAAQEILDKFINKSKTKHDRRNMKRLRAAMAVASWEVGSGRLITSEELSRISIETYAYDIQYGLVLQMKKLLFGDDQYKGYKITEDKTMPVEDFRKEIEIILNLIGHKEADCPLATPSCTPLGFNTAFKVVFSTQVVSPSIIRECVKQILDGGKYLKAEPFFDALMKLEKGRSAPQAAGGLNED